MKILPTEVKLVAKLLQEPAEDAEQLARTILVELEQARSKRKHWVVLTQDPTGLTSAWGTYPTLLQAQKAIGNPIIASRPGTKAMFLLLHYSLEDADATK